MTGINDFPAELMLKIFLLLSPSDLKAAVLVSKAWKELGDPVLWSRCTVKITNHQQLYVLSFRRFKYIEKIAIDTNYNFDPNSYFEVWQPCELEALFKVVMKLPKLKEIEGLGGADLKMVDPDLLSRIFVKMEDVGNLNDSDLTDDQYEALFTKLAKGNTTLKKMCLEWVDLYRIEAELMATAIARLERIYMFGACITDEQATAIFSAISQGTHLKKLHFKYIDLSFIDPKVLASAVVRVDKVFLNSADLTTVQLTSILTSVQENTNLKHLNLSGNDTNNVDLNFVTRARAMLGDSLELDVFDDDDDYHHVITADYSGFLDIEDTDDDIDDCWALEGLFCPHKCCQN